MKTVNSIYLSTVGSGVYNFFDSTQTATLESIAYQDPITGGNGVYMARVLLRIDVVDDVDSTRSYIPTEEIVQNKKEEALYRLYPNPNNGLMTFAYQLEAEQNGALILYDITGRNINSYSFFSSDNKLLIDEAELKQGVYFYRVIVGDKQVAADKLIIVK